MLLTNQIAGIFIPEGIDGKNKKNKETESQFYRYGVIKWMFEFLIFLLLVIRTVYWLTDGLDSVKISIKQK